MRAYCVQVAAQAGAAPTCPGIPDLHVDSAGSPSPQPAAQRKPQCGLCGHPLHQSQQSGTRAQCGLYHGPVHTASGAALQLVWAQRPATILRPAVQARCPTCATAAASASSSCATATAAAASAARRHAGQLAQALADDLLNVLALHLADQLVHTVAVSLNAHCRAGRE